MKYHIYRVLAVAWTFSIMESCKKCYKSGNNWIILPILYYSTHCMFCHLFDWFYMDFHSSLLYSVLYPYTHDFMHNFNFVSNICVIVLLCISSFLSTFLHENKSPSLKTSCGGNLIKSRKKCRMVNYSFTFLYKGAVCPIIQ